MSSATERPRPAASGIDSRIIAIAGAMLALVFVLTRVPQVPIPGGGYIHLGDTGIYAASFLFGPIVGFFAAAFGTTFSDLSAGAGVWAPGTFVIHGVQGIVAAYMAWRRGLAAMVSAAIVGGVVVVAGYFFYQWLILGKLDPEQGLGPALAGVPLNILQVVVGGVLGIALVIAVRRAYPPVDTFGQATVWEDRGA